MSRAPGELVAADAGAESVLVVDGTPGIGGTRRRGQRLGVVFWICSAWVILMIMLAVLASVLPLKAPNFQDYSAVNVGPSARHLLGTDDLGRDLLSRLIFGARVSLVVGFCSVAIGMLALPPFVIAPIMVAVFAVGLHWFPATGYIPFTQAPATNLHDMILPSLAITAGSIAVYYRLFRSDLISTLQEDFITMARSKGLSNRRIMWRHAFRPSSFSLLAAAGVNIGALIAGTYIVEVLFALPGLGYSLVQAVDQRDYLVVQGITLVVAVAYVVLQFLIDFLFTVVDPRVTRE